MALAVRITPNVADATAFPGCPRLTMLNALVASTLKVSFV